MDTVKIRGSNIPILHNLLDSENIALRSRDLSKVLEDNVYPGRFYGRPTSTMA